MIDRYKCRIEKNWARPNSEMEIQLIAKKKMYIGRNKKKKRNREKKHQPKNIILNTNQKGKKTSEKTANDSFDINRINGC